MDSEETKVHSEWDPDWIPHFRWHFKRALHTSFGRADEFSNIKHVLGSVMCWKLTHETVWEQQSTKTNRHVGRVALLVTCIRISIRIAQQVNVRPHHNNLHVYSTARTAPLTFIASHFIFYVVSSSPILFPHFRRMFLLCCNQMFVCVCVALARASMIFTACMKNRAPSINLFFCSSTLTSIVKWLGVHCQGESIEATLHASCRLSAAYSACGT